MPNQGKDRRNILRALTLAALGAIVTSPAVIHFLFAAPESPPGGSSGSTRTKDVAGLYATHCRACHGAAGRGQDLRAALPTMPDFASPVWQAALTDAEIARRIRDGNAPDMPAFRDKLTKDQHLALAAHLRTFAAKREKPAAPRAAMTPEQLYRANGCVKCHDRDGRGGGVRKAMPEIPDFTDGKWQKDHGDDDLARSIVEGKGKFMQSQKDKLSKEAVKQLVALVRAFKDGKQTIPEELKNPPKPPDPPKAERAAATATPNGPNAADEARALALRAGGALYREKCLNCHGKDGRGAGPGTNLPDVPDFTSPPWQNARSDAQLSVSILDGKGTLMPSFRDQVKAGQLKPLLTYVRAFGPVPAAVKETKTSAFEEEFRRLEEEWEALKKQQDELTNKTKKP